MSLNNVIIPASALARSAVQTMQKLRQAQMDPIKTNRKQVVRWPDVLLATYWTSLFVATHWPRMPRIAIPGKDRTAHAVAYAILASLLFLCVRRRTGKPVSLSAAAKISLLTATYAVLDEVLQPLTGRTADMFDWLADVFGALAVAAVYLAITRLRAAVTDT